jgi:hypothetical protein
MKQNHVFTKNINIEAGYLHSIIVLFFCDVQFLFTRSKFELALTEYYLEQRHFLLC